VKGGVQHAGGWLSLIVALDTAPHVFALLTRTNFTLLPMRLQIKKDYEFIHCPDEAVGVKPKGPAPITVT
jgi:hypothetical protein